MDDLKNKQKKTILISLVFLAGFAFLLYLGERYLYRIDVEEDGQFKAESVSRTIQAYVSQTDALSTWFFNKIEDNVKLMTFMLRDQVSDGKYNGRVMFEDGMVVRIHNGQPELPPEARNLFPELTMENLSSDNSSNLVETADGDSVYLTCGLISGEWYYIDWTSYQEYEEFFDTQLDFQRLLSYMSNAYGGELFVIPEDAAFETVVAKTDRFAEFDNLSDLGLKRSDIEKGSFRLKTKSAEYMCYVLPMTDFGAQVVYCDLLNNENQESLHRIITGVLFAASFLGAMITFCFSVRWDIQNQLLSESEARKYSPERMKKRTLLYGLLAGACLICIMAFSTLVQKSHHENEKGKKILDSLELQLAAADRQISDAVAAEIDWYAYFGERIASYLAENAALPEKEKLAEIARIISADLIMVFDEEGREILCSSDYIGFALDDGAAGEGGPDFRKLLNGVPVIIHGPGNNFVSGQEHYVIGVRYMMPDSFRYGALLIFVDPSKLTFRQDADITGYIYPNLVTDEDLIIEMDAEKNEILSSSGDRFSKSDMQFLDVSSESARKDGLDFFLLDNIPYYGLLRNTGEKIYYYGARISGLVLSTVLNLAEVLIFVVGALLIMRYAMKGYSQEYVGSVPAAGRDAGPEDKWTGMAAESAHTFFADLIRRWEAFSPEQKASRVLGVLCGLSMLLLLAAGFFSKNSTMAFYITGNWQKGLNPFSVAAIMIVLCLWRLLFILTDVIFTIIYTEADTKQKTIGQLVHSLLKFVLFVALIYNSLSYLGVDTRALLASVGIISLALSLGAKDLVSDILAGLGIVYEGSFLSGEIVEIDGFRGVIEEIGIRSTKIRSIGSNNIKIINNQEIRNVINYSRELSLFVIEIELPAVLPIEMVKEYLARELPAVREELPEIVNGPVFGGISYIDRYKMKITIIGQCLEKDVFMVKRKMNMQLKERIDKLLDLSFK